MNSTAEDSDAKQLNGFTHINGVISGDKMVEIPLEDKAESEEGKRAKNVQIEDDLHGKIAHPTSYAETLTNFLRGNLGPGMLAMGNATKNAGIIVGPIGIAVLGMICLHCQHQLLSAAKEVQRRTGMTTPPGFSQTVELCFSTGHPALRKFAGCMKAAVTVFLVLTQLGICCVYFVFISTNVKQVLETHGHHLNIHLIMAFILVPILLTCLIRNLKYLAILSTIANVLMLTGIIIVIYFITKDLPPVTSRRYVGNISAMPLFFGAALYAFEGIGLVLPMQREMKKPQDFKRPWGVLNIGVVIMILLFIIIGFLTFLKFGEGTGGSVTLDLDPNDILSQVVKIIISTGVLLTFSLQFYIPVIIMWPKISEKLGPFSQPVLMELVFRTLLVLATFVLAEVIPYLDLFISLVGAVSSTALAVLIPPILEMAVKWNVSDLSVTVVIKNSLILLLGVLGCVTGTYESLVEIVHAMTHEEL